MFAHIAIHYPKPEYRDELLASMHRLDAAAQGSPGLVSIGDWSEADGGTRLIGIAIWESRQQFEDAGEQIFAAVAGDPFDLWQERKADNLFLERD